MALDPARPHTWELLEGREYGGRVRVASEEEAIRLVQELRRRLEDLEANATANPEGWWPLILEQADAGLL